MKRPSPVSTGIHLNPDNSRVLIRSFIPSSRTAVQSVVERALEPSEYELHNRLAALHLLFDDRHHDMESAWRRHYDHVRHDIPDEASFSEERRLYIGSLFSGEYALESAALFNPSMVPHPDQSGLEKGALRFILSLRATGEGHISSITFRSGVIGSDHEITIDPTSRHVTAPELNPDPSFRRNSFAHELQKMEFNDPWTKDLLGSLGDRFTRSELNDAIRRVSGARRASAKNVRRTTECIHWLTEVNYEVHFNPTIPLAGRVIFPVSPTERNGMEDARFVKFTDENGCTTYYATYTAYNGRTILPQLLETEDFLTFRASTLNGSGVRNKGMALFPRKIGGRFMMISRQDDESLYLMDSDDIHLWEEARFLRGPHESWEASKIGNCGSPLETEKGWLLITHGVGPMRRYCIGAILLDLEDPSKVIGHLEHPLIEPDEPQRNGYVPNVVYTCGSHIHQGRLILPYALNDTSIKIVTFGLDELLESFSTSPETKRAGEPLRIE